MKNLFEKVYASHGSGQSFANTRRFDPYKSFRFLVDISGNMVFAKAGFQKVTGLKMKTAVVEYREGGDDIGVIKSPGLVTFDPITCTRGMSEDGDMWTWAMKSFNKTTDASGIDPDMRAQVAISLKDRDGVTVVKKWQISSAWVSEYSTGDFDATGNNIMIESMTLEQEGFAKVVG